MEIQNLGGHSGCKILLFDQGGGTHFVRKISSSQEYNDRLAAQCQKQISYKSEIIHVPKVLRQGYTEEKLFYFDMEYVRGTMLSQYIKNIEVNKIRHLVETIVNSIIKFNHTAQEPGIVQNIFIEKINSIEIATKKKYWSAQTQKLFDCLKEHDWNRFPNSQCHGDLTLENIIIVGDTLYCIDFLDSFYDSWFLDVGKLLQDVQVMWSYRYDERPNPNTVIRLRIFRDLLLEQIEKVEPHALLEVHYALLLHLARIYPYVKDQCTLEFLERKTSLLIEKLQRQEALS